jgi:hypothetical protein
MNRHPGNTALIEQEQEVKKNAQSFFLELDRRAFLTLLASCAITVNLPGCFGPAPPLEELAAWLGLQPKEKVWLSDLSSRQQQKLYESLNTLKSESVSPQILDLMVDIFGARSRLFPYLEYPQVADNRSMCDGLIQE